VTDPAVQRGPGRPRLFAEDEILEVAERLLADRGVAAVSVRRIGEALGCAPMTLYTTFASKRAMLDALAARLLGRHDTLPDDSLALDQRIREWMWRFRRAATDGRLYELFSDGPPQATLVTTVATWIGQLCAEGWDEQSATVEAQHLLWTVNGFCLTQASAGRRLAPSVLRQVDPSVREWARRFLAYQPTTDVDDLFARTVEATIAGLRTGMAT